MGRGKEWSKEESLHLAEAWVQMSEGEGANRVIGTNQTMEQFWRGVMDIFVTKAPQPTPPGVYGNREWTALKSHWSEGVSRDVKRFRKSLNRVYARNLSGVSEQDKINIAVVLHRGISDAPDYRLASYDPTLWKFYDCWLFLRTHPAFMFNVDQNVSTTESQQTLSSTASLSLENDDSIDHGGEMEPRDIILATPTTDASIQSRSRGPGPGIRKTKSIAMDDDFKKKRMKFNDDFLRTLAQRQETYSKYVSSMQQNQIFKNAAIGFEMFKDSDPEEAEKYKKKMMAVMEESTNDDNNDTSIDDASSQND
jgi:hypothetical protein